MNSTYAICGTIFFVAFAFIAATHGTGLALPWIAFSLLVAGISQFFAQGSTTTSYTISWVAATMAMLTAIAALIAFVIDVTL